MTQRVEALVGYTVRGELFDNRLTAERRRRYNVRVHDEEDIIDDLGMIVLLEDENPPSDKAICIVLVAIVIVFVVCLAL